MARIIISSQESNARLTAYALAARGHGVSWVDAHGASQPFGGAVDLFGERAEAVSVVPDADLGDGPLVGVVYAEGEDVAAGIAAVTADARPDLIVIMGGGVAGVVTAAAEAERIGFPADRIVMTGGFAFGGSIADDVVVISSEKSRLISGFASTPSPEVADLFAQVLPAAEVVDLAVAAFSSNNAIIHVPGMLLNAVSIERGDQLRFYVEGYGEAVCRLAEAIDADRIEIGRAVGIELPTFESILDRYYAGEGMAGASLHEKITTFPEYGSLIIPHSFEHRYLVHELVSTFIPLRMIADRVGVPAETIKACIRLGEILVGRELKADVSDAQVARFITT